jgi:hypothetical protein
MNQDFDIASLEVAETGTLDVLDVKQEPLLGIGGKPVSIELYGPGSQQYVRAKAKTEAAIQTRAMAAVRGKVAKDAATENRRLVAEQLAACTKAIHNLPGDALAIYSNPKLGYITEQAEKFVQDWANFPSASTTT